MNFKKKSIFSRSLRAGESDAEEKLQGGILAVWGSPGSGKTVTAVKIVKYLADKISNILS